MPKLFPYKKILDARIVLFAKIFLVIALLVFFLPLLILPFYNHPFADDYFCGYNLNNKGFIAYQAFIYENWGGRFAATFVGSLFAYHNFLYQHYYMHSLLLIGLNFCSIFFLINCISKYVLKNNYSCSKKLLTTSLFLALETCSLPQVSTFIFWFSSAITYHLAVILIQFEIALFILLYNIHKDLTKITCTVLLPLIVFISIGFNELFIVVHIFLFLTIFWLRLYKKSSVVFILCFIAFIAGSVLLLSASGNRLRMHELVSKSIFTGIAAIAYHTSEILWNIFKNPFFWFMAIVIFFYGNHNKINWQHNLFIQKLVFNKWKLSCLIVLFLIASVTLPVTALKGGIIPDRYVNAVICFMLIQLLLYFFILGNSIQLKILVMFPSTKKAIIYFLFSLGLMCNNYIVDAYKSLVIAPVYSTILNQREATLKSASAGKRIAIIKSYDAALSNLLQNKYNSTSTTYHQLLQQKPPLLFFEDDLATEPSIIVLKNYYRINNIQIKK